MIFPPCSLSQPLNTAQCLAQDFLSLLPTQSQPLPRGATISPLPLALDQPFVHLFYFQRQHGGCVDPNPIYLQRPDPSLIALWHDSVEASWLCKYSDPDSTPSVIWADWFRENTMSLVNGMQPPTDHRPSGLISEEHVLHMRDTVSWAALVSRTRPTALLFGFHSFTAQKFRCLQ